MIEELRVKDKDYDNKTEVIVAYHELLHKLKETKKSPQQEDPIKEEKKRTVERIAKETPTESANHFENLKRSLNSSIDDVKERYLAEQKTLILLVQGIELKTNELAELHDIKVNIDTLSALLLAQKEKSTAFEKEMNEARQHFEQEMVEKHREWQQEEQKYVYQRDLAREKDRNRYEMAKHSLEQELTSMRFKAQKEFDEREARIVANEQDLQRLEQYKEKIAQMPEELRKAVQKAEETLTKQLTTKFDYEAQLLQKEIKLNEQTVATLEAKISMLETNISHFESLKNSFNRLLFNSNEG
jgi:hypothetical protein